MFQLLRRFKDRRRSLPKRQVTRSKRNEPPRRAVARRITPFLPNWWGLVGSQIASWAALGPSFLPRRWWTTAISVSFAQLYGYAVGSGARTTRDAIGRLFGVRRDAHPSLNKATAERVTQTTILSGLVVGTAWALVNAHERQHEIARLVDEKPQTARAQFGGFALGTMGTGFILTLVQLFRFSSARTRALIGRLAPPLAAPLSGSLVVGLGVYAINRYFVGSQLMTKLRESAELKNILPLPGRVPPTQPERSGSPESFEPYNSLGRHGRSVASDGPRAADIEQFWGEPAMEPVRAYIGLSPTLSIPAAAKRAVRELERAGGFQRKHIVIFIGTGTGWLNDWSMSAIEYLTRGNCAVVSLQYTVLSSALALVADRRSPQLTAQSLYNEISAHLDTLPADERPKLYMSGESLGAFGGLSTFSDAKDMAALLDGAVWAGTPQFTPMWESLTARRNPGSPYIRPDIGDGSLIRFMNRVGDENRNAAGAPYAHWGPRRFVFLQHPSDPIVWWHPTLIWKKPEWFNEPAGYDVTTHMRWWPWVTFCQIWADTPLSLANKGGHAHRYFESYVTAWSQVLGIDAPIARLEQEIRPLIKPH